MTKRQGKAGKHMVKITDIEHRSRAHRAGIRADDVLLSINGHEINDVLDYRFYLAEETVELSLSRGGELYSVRIEKEEYDDIGLLFETPLMDKKHSCRNKCIFCFIDQLPKGMRESLYFKDDDSRLSFLHGNYITMTNLSERDIARILEMKITPVNVSVHTTNPDLRCEIMKNKHAGEVLSYLDTLANGGVELRCQIVLCRGVNDGAELDRSMRDLAALFPRVTSVSVVPAGLTGHREGLYPLEPYTPEECAEIIRQVTAFGDACEAEHGHRIFFCADELYIKAGLPLPEGLFYEGYLQIENGVGMIASIKEEFDREIEFIDEHDRYVTRRVSVATGEAAYGVISELSERLMALCPNLTVNVYPIKNVFFGGEVNVTGLVTGEDMVKALLGKDLGDELIFSETMLRSEKDLFLCGMTPTELSARLNVPVRAVPNDGASLIEALLGEEMI